jgi:excisionase family DNA binding protein
MSITNKKDVLTTGEVAKICHVAPRTVSKWFDTGKLRGYRIPGSKDRRIPRRQLEAFLRAHDIPFDEADLGSCRVLLVDPQFSAETIEQVTAPGRYEIRTAANEFEAGMLAQQLRPHVIVMRLRDVREAEEVHANIASSESLQATKVIAAIAGADDAARQKLRSLGYDECLDWPYEPQQLVRAIEQATNLIT